MRDCLIAKLLSYTTDIKEESPKKRLIFSQYSNGKRWWKNDKVFQKLKNYD